MEMNYDWASTRKTAEELFDLPWNEEAIKQADDVFKQEGMSFKQARRMVFLYAHLVSHHSNPKNYSLKDRVRIALYWLFNGWKGF